MSEPVPPFQPDLDLIERRVSVPAWVDAALVFCAVLLVVIWGLTQ